MVCGHNHTWAHRTEAWAQWYVGTITRGHIGLKRGHNGMLAQSHVGSSDSGIGTVTCSHFSFKTKCTEDIKIIEVSA